LRHVQAAAGDHGQANRRRVSAGGAGTGGARRVSAEEREQADHRKKGDDLEEWHLHAVVHFGFSCFASAL
jgi:hypothetical protein